MSAHATPTPTATHLQPAAPRRGVVLFSHGSRDPLWRLPIEAVQARLKADQPDLQVCCAYLELTVPDLGAAAGQLVQEGAEHITIVPMFLGTGRHAREDLPVLVEQLRQAHGERVRFHVQQAIGEDPRMTALMAQIAAEPSSNL